MTKNDNNAPDSKSTTLLSRILGKPIEVPELTTRNEYFLYMFKHGWYRVVGILVDWYFVCEMLDLMNNPNFNYLGSGTQFLMYIFFSFLLLQLPIGIVKYFRNLFLPAFLSYCRNIQK